MSETQPQNVAYPGLFKGTYYVDPAFTGLQSGSQSNPFTTIAAAFAAAIALSLPGAVIRIPPGVTITENVVFPSTAGTWEIMADAGFISSSVGSRITGTITCNAAATVAIRLTTLIINGNITGLCSAGFAELVLTNVRHIGTTTLTTSGAGVWIATCKGVGSPSANKTGGSSSGLVSVAGELLASNWVFEGGITEAQIGPLNPPNGSQFHDCQFGSTAGAAVPIGLNATTPNALFVDCYFNGPVTFTAGTANYVVKVDGASLSSLMTQGVTLVGTGITLLSVNSNGSSAQTIANNVASTAFGNRDPAGLYEVVFDMTLLAAGTAGTMQLNAIYTDMTGTLTTAAVGGAGGQLLITAAVGTKASGSLQFQHNGAAAAIAFSVTGVVTPGALSVALAVALRRVN
ncbi:MAG: hypothetical protein V4567_05370 [Pseudomonadota bacterium]